MNNNKNRPDTMNKPKILVIDDKLGGEYDRYPIYDAFLSDFFDPSYCSDQSKVVEEIGKRYEMLITDKTLSTWCYSVKDIIDLASEDKKKPPIIIVSQYWDFDEETKLYEILTLKLKYNIINLYPWQHIASAAPAIIEEWRSKIIWDFLKYYKKHARLNNDNSPIKILHMADMQFGGSTNKKAIADNVAIASDLRNSGWSPEMIAVCGDIAQGGKAKEYKIAQEWFNEFLEILWEERKEENNILFSVGNHDCNFDAFSQFYNTAVFPDKIDKNSTVEIKKNVKEPKGKAIWDNSENCINIEEIVFFNYMKFLDDMTSKSNSIIPEKHLNTIDDSYLYWGLRIVLINSLDGISPEHPHGAGINEDDIKAISDHCARNTVDNLFTIIVTHYSPKDLGYIGPEDGDGQWEAIRSFIINIRANLWLCGHIHEAIIEKLILANEGPHKNIVCASTGSLRLDSASIPRGAVNGFSKIELLRKDGIITKIQIESNKLVNNCQVPYDIKTFELTRDGNSISGIDMKITNPDFEQDDYTVRDRSTRGIRGIK